MFAGFGEPTAHADILRMIRAVKTLGLRVEITTNGTLLDGPMIDGPSAGRAGYGTWASFGSAGEKGFEDIRRGEILPEAIVAALPAPGGNVRGRRKIPGRHRFVRRLRRNVADLVNGRPGREVGADKIPGQQHPALLKTWKGDALRPDPVDGDLFFGGRDDLTRMDVASHTRRPFSIFSRVTRTGHDGASHFRRNSFCRFVGEEDGLLSAGTNKSPLPGASSVYDLSLWIRTKHQAAWIRKCRAENTGMHLAFAELRRFREKIRNFDFAPAISAVDATCSNPTTKTVRQHSLLAGVPLGPGPHPVPLE